MKFKIGDKVKWHNPVWATGYHNMGVVSGYNKSGKMIIDWETYNDSIVFSKVAIQDLGTVALVEPAGYQDFKDKIKDRMTI